MSIKTWLTEFYPIDAWEAVKRGDDPVAHSLRKWRGLTDDNLAKHNLTHGLFGSLTDPATGHTVFSVDDTTCALCAAHLDQDTGRCSGCPLYALRDSLPCDASSDDGLSPYARYTIAGDPGPMIALLEQAADAG